MNDAAEALEHEVVAESGIVAVLNKSEIDQQIATAHRYPRSLKTFKDQALEMVTLSERIAEQCIYSVPRDGKTIEGASARFAEIIACAWRNNRAGARVISDHGDFVTAQGIFIDLENNHTITQEVQRRIVDKRGRRFSPDMIGVTANAACSIALRNAILKGIPKPFWEPMYEAARRTVMGNFKTLANRRAEALAEFQRYGIKQDQICRQLEVAGVEDIGLEHLVTLKGMLTAIQEGDTTPEEAFAESKPVAMPQPKQAAQPQTIDQQTGEVKPSERPGLLLPAQAKSVRDMLDNRDLADAFAKEFGISDPSELPLSKLDAAMGWIRSHTPKAAPK